MKVLIILNDPPYGSERSYNGIRRANNLVRAETRPDVTVFLMGDAVSCAKRGQQTPDGHYNVERMLKPLVRNGQVLLCGTCMDARGLTEEEIVEGSRRSTLDELTDLTLMVDRTLVF